MSCVRYPSSYSGMPMRTMRAQPAMRAMRSHPVTGGPAPLPDSLYNYGHMSYIPPPFTGKPWETMMNGKAVDLSPYASQVLDDNAETIGPPFMKRAGPYVFPTNQTKVTHPGYVTPVGDNNMVVNPAVICSPFNNLFYSPPPSDVCGHYPR